MPEKRRPKTLRDARTCRDLFESWDPMFSETVDRTRGPRTEAILAALGASVGQPARVLDLASGPGPVTARLLARFPGCHVVALDTDPVLLQIGRAALHQDRTRVDWVLADLRQAGWSSNLGPEGFDAIVTSLALHWFYRAELRAIYRAARALLRSQGVLINGDFLPARTSQVAPAGGPSTPPRSTPASSPAGDVTGFQQRWADWWKVVAATPSLADALRSRQLRLPGPMPPRRATGPKRPAPLEWHERTLRSVGFRRVAMRWQDRDFHVLTALR